MKIVVGSNGDWDLNRDDDGMLVAWWNRNDRRIYVAIAGKPQLKHLSATPATEAHGLLILNAIKQQLEAEDDSE